MILKLLEKSFNTHDSIELQSLEKEIDEISKSYLINGVTRASIWINKNLCEINSPIINIKNTNLLEIALKICKNLNDKTSKKFTNGKVVSILEGGYNLLALQDSAKRHVDALIEFN